MGRAGGEHSLFERAGTAVCCPSAQRRLLSKVRLLGIIITHAYQSGAVLAKKLNLTVQRSVVHSHERGGSMCMINLLDRGNGENLIVDV